jgi:hypothetical protein
MLLFWLSDSKEPQRNEGSLQECSIYQTATLSITCAISEIRLENIFAFYW